MSDTIKCIYCDQNKDVTDFSLEHVIPQFLGGAYAPYHYKIRTVCKRCNSILGLFVDASFARDYIVNHALVEAAHSLFDPNKTKSLPLRCMGTGDFQVPSLSDKETCEFWLGPLGEQVYWIRPIDERLYWYSGGNPRTAKEVETKAYYMFAEHSKKNITLSFKSLVDSFDDRRIKKIMCTKVEGTNVNHFGFSDPDEIDLARIEFFKSLGENYRGLKVAMNTKYDHRFMAKFGLGISYSLFGDRVLTSDYTKELRRGVWYKEGDPIPQIVGTTALNQPNNDDTFKHLTGISNAVTITIMPTSIGICANLNICQRLNWTVKCSSQEVIENSFLGRFGEGIAIILFKPLQKGIEIPFVDFVAHKNGSLINTELQSIEKKADLHKDYFKNL